MPKIDIVKPLATGWMLWPRAAMFYDTLRGEAWLPFFSALNGIVYFNLHTIDPEECASLKLNLHLPKVGITTKCNPCARYTALSVMNTHGRPEFTVTWSHGPPTLESPEFVNSNVFVHDGSRGTIAHLGDPNNARDLAHRLSLCNSVLPQPHGPRRHDYLTLVARRGYSLFRLPPNIYIDGRNQEGAPKPFVPRSMAAAAAAEAVAAALPAPVEEKKKRKAKAQTREIELLNAGADAGIAQWRAKRQATEAKAVDLDSEAAWHALGEKLGLVAGFTKDELRPYLHLIDGARVTFQATTVNINVVWKK